MSAATSIPSTSSSRPPPNSVLFARDQSWGGPESAQKRTWLASVIVDDFEEQNDPIPDVEFVEDRLLQVLEDEFDLVLEDDSSKGIADEIVKLWEAIQLGGTRGLERVIALEEKADKVKGKKLQVEEGAANDSDWEDESGESDEEGDLRASADAGEVPTLLDHAQCSKPEAEVDEDGFTVVKGKSRAHR
ncbi:unnamed protein product [Somion occarium]|uniref:Pre-rRNA-processing protein TSR2 n=1 Tax=Somion occarium TaxID=3059160 RepID=A0ABP1CSH7_9APHY